MPRKRKEVSESYNQKAYLDPANPTAFSGLQTFAKARKIGDLKALEKSLAKLPSFSRFRPPRTNYPRRPVIVKSPNENLQLDLIDYSRIKTKNRGFSYILIGIDLFTKFCIAKALKSKSVKHVVPALAELFKEFSKKAPIQSVCFDRESSFYSKEAKQLYKKLGIHYFSTFSPLKSQTVERLIRTIKSRLHRLLDYKKTNNWLDNYEKVVSGYNLTRSRSHGFVPAKIKKSDYDTVLSNLYKRFALMRPKKPKFKKLDLVRVSDRKLKTFKKKYLSHWSSEVFRIKCILTQFPVVSYKVEDLNGQELQGTFVEYDLTPAGIQNEQEQRASRGRFRSKPQRFSGQQ